jgi:sideroflexin-5
VGATGLEQAKNLIVEYKQGRLSGMTPELWKAKKIVDSTLHPGTRTRDRLDHYSRVES